MEKKDTKIIQDKLEVKFSKIKSINNKVMENGTRNKERSKTGWRDKAYGMKL